MKNSQKIINYFMLTGTWSTLSNRVTICSTLYWGKIFFYYYHFVPSLPLRNNLRSRLFYSQSLSLKGRKKDCTGRWVLVISGGAVPARQIQFARSDTAFQNGLWNSLLREPYRELAVINIFHHLVFLSFILR